MEYVLNPYALPVTPPVEESINMPTRKSVLQANTGDAFNLYKKASYRLLDIEGWNNVREGRKDQYKLFDSNGLPKEGIAQQGDYIRFSPPVTSSKKPMIFYWVRVERVLSIKTEEHESTAMRVQPANDPTIKITGTRTFYPKTKITHTFIVERLGHVVSAGIQPRNAIPNALQVKGIGNKWLTLFNSLKARLGFAKSQWAVLIDGLLEEE